MNESLEPCPFCGKPAEVRPVGCRVIEWVALCPREVGEETCPVAPMGRHHATRAGAVAAWNRRSHHNKALLTNKALLNDADRGPE